MDNKKKNIIYIITAIVLILTIIVSGYLIITKFNGNLNSDNKNVKTKGIPNKPVINLYMEKVSNFNKYTEGNWSNKDIIAVASSTSTGRKYYDYKITGAINKTGRGSKVTINKEGVSYIRFRTCYYDNGKCSAYSSPAKTIKIDKTAPTLITSSNMNNNGTGTISIKCNDNNGVLLTYCYYEGKNRICHAGKHNQKNTSGTFKIKKTNNKNVNIQLICYDDAGNSSTKTYASYVLNK